MNITSKSDMAQVTKIPQMLNFFIYISITLCCFTNLASANLELDEDNWTEILDGEWMVEFYAPWCPACSALGPAWRELSQRAASKKMAVRTAAVDVTKSPGLSGRFMVTALPTIFHVKDGEFRQYKGPRDTDSMETFVERARWKQTEPLPSWKAPHSFQMGVVAHFFKLSQALRSVHTELMDTYGLPTWGSYLIFAVGTIFIGALLGLILVCVIDLLYPPRRAERVAVSRAEAHERLQAERDARKSDDEQELINDDLLDDADLMNASDDEKNSPSDTSDDDKENQVQKTAEGAGDTKEKEDKQEVRKRRPRKAD